MHTMRPKFQTNFFKHMLRVRVSLIPVITAQYRTEKAFVEKYKRSDQFQKSTLWSKQQNTMLKKPIETLV